MEEEKNDAEYPETVLRQAAIGYETAIHLWSGESSNRMANYNTMLVANSLILAAIGFSYQNTNNLYQIVRLLLTYLGIILCVVWYISERRMIEKAIYYMYAAREIEEKYFGKVFNVLNRGSQFSKGKEVEFLINQQRMLRKMSTWLRPKIQWSFSVLIFIFFSIYLLVLVVERIEIIRLSLLVFIQITFGNLSPTNWRIL